MTRTVLAFLLAVFAVFASASAARYNKYPAAVRHRRFTFCSPTGADCMAPVPKRLIMAHTRTHFRAHERPLTDLPSPHR